MRLAVGRLRVLVGFSFSVSRKPREEILYDKARAYAERSLEERYPPRKVRRFDTEKIIQWNWSSLLDSRTATLLAEQKSVLAILDGKPAAWRTADRSAIPRWRWYKRRRFERLLCEGYRIAKWW